MLSVCRACSLLHGNAGWRLDDVEAIVMPLHFAQTCELTKFRLGHESLSGSVVQCENIPEYFGPQLVCYPPNLYFNHELWDCISGPINTTIMLIVSSHNGSCCTFVTKWRRNPL
jgi:hypothetical protein